MWPVGACEDAARGVEGAIDTDGDSWLAGAG
jgi:hypothetical protein